MGRKEEEAAWARVGKKPPAPSRHSKPKKPKPTSEQQAAAAAAGRRQGIMEKLPPTGFQRLQEVLNPKKPKKKK